MKDKARIASLGFLLCVCAASPARSKAIAIHVDSTQAQAAGGALVKGSNIQIKDGQGSVDIFCQIPVQGEYQVWLSYRSPNTTKAKLTVLADDQKLIAPLQHTPEAGQYFRHFMGTVSNVQAGELSVRTAVENSAPDFLFHGMELTKVPRLDQELKPLFQTALDFYDKLLRAPNGLYRDVHLLDDAGRPQGATSNICSIAAVGIGLMSLCMTYELAHHPGAEEKALQSLRAVNGKAPGLKPDREKSGFFRHFLNIEDGSGKSEFSTIDTAIMVTGALYCRNTFDNPQIKQEADELWNSIDWPVALADTYGEQLFMMIEDGEPVATSKTSLFNEYYILAWLIQQAQLQERGKSDVLRFQARRCSYREMTLLCSRRSGPQCSFVIQFPLYMCHPCTHSNLYFSFVAAQARADHLSCSERVGVDEYWGCGAGGTPRDGYYASTYDSNPGNVVSPRVIAGFMPAYPQAQDHLLKLYRDPARRLKTDAGELLPRFSIGEPEWRHHRIEAIDFASMLFGLAAIHPKLGMEFFQEKTKFTFNK